jgi:hypothetical protein
MICVVLKDAARLHRQVAKWRTKLKWRAASGCKVGEVIIGNVQEDAEENHENQSE